LVAGLIADRPRTAGVLISPSEAAVAERLLRGIHVGAAALLAVIAGAGVGRFAERCELQTHICQTSAPPITNSLTAAC